MRVLFIHSDHLEFEARKEAGGPDLAETEGVPMEGRMEECVTAFITVEADDEDELDGVVQNAATELRDVAGQLGTRNVVLYPYAHLSEDLASPSAAKTVLRNLEAELDDFEVLRAPFGWYKSFEISCKGHPLSELSRHVHGHLDVADHEPDTADTAPSEWFVLDADGERVPAVDAKPDVNDDLRAFIADEVEGVTAHAGEQPPHLDVMLEKEFVGYDDLSDVGNLRWYPRGKLVRDSLMQYVNDLVIEYGGMPVETPIMYDLGARAIDEHAGKFGERQYRFDSGDRRMMLRFAACFGQFSIMRDMYISVNDLPLRIYEMSTYSFRREQHGEVVGLKRQRAFTMPDMHTATKDIEQAKAEFERQATLALETSHDLGLNYEAAFRVTEAFSEDHADWIEGVVADFGKPVLLEVLPERRHYWSAKIDFAVIDGLGRPMENPTVQIDVESAERFEIVYHDGTNQHHPQILHYSPSGSIERMMGALLEHTANQEVPRLPTWLSPTQVRFIPVGEDHVGFCDDLVDDLEATGVRADVDDRDESVGKRIAKTERDWVPYYVVVGGREIESGTLGVNVRETGEELDMPPGELEARVLGDVGDLPKRSRYLPRHVSDHPHFTGR